MTKSLHFMVLNERNETLNTSFHWASGRMYMPYSMRRSPEEWMKLVLECRKSGMSDRQCCIANDISYYTFASAIKNLRRMNYEIPKSKDFDIHDLALPKQDVVKVDIVNDIQPPMECIPEVASHIDNSHMIEIKLGDVHIYLCNGADPDLVARTLSALRSFV